MVVVTLDKEEELLILVEIFHSWKLKSFLCGGL